MDEPAVLSHPEIRKLRACVRPLLLDSGIDEAPVGLWGTCVLAYLGPHLFVITAGHLVRSNHSGQVRVLPTDKSPTRLLLSQGVAHQPDQDDEEIDLTVFPAVTDGLSRQALKRSQFLDLAALSKSDWQDTAAVAQFGVVGYPRDISEVDYDSRRVMAHQVFLPAVYESPFSGAKYLHTLRTSNPLELEQFAGFSGGAVFSFQPQVGASSVPRFCGVVVQGTASSGLVHFVDARLALGLAHQAALNASKFGLRLAKPMKKFQK